ncbi:heme exporter protein CcmD [Psychrobium sp. 1_MG-2023]|uniref:heme exporter protein CcmD n=1 Tax=Psychrobium sp. 1_MG-2023 TaxID=3062624 RepID=UPI000C31D14B|nr:heme exporter protein CcmD [Psychrobium sp. 1_MG-2023]MDP2562632.1 heme exporter protein CcmD [Psychrobium sp. 1_MG-2023]PKF54388.1 heme exporter protein CcmD [Alteromonadales bacterium alter-6D02]
MHFANFNDFIDMGGYAFFVWLSYGCAFFLIISLTVVSVRRRKSLLREIQSKQQRDEKLKQLRKGKNSNEPKT